MGEADKLGSLTGKEVVDATPLPVRTATKPGAPAAKTAVAKPTSAKKP